MESKNLNNGKKVVTFGEVMLRLTTPGFKRFAQAGEFVATYGGSEANVALSLAHFGVPTEFVTRLPDNAIARACIASLRAGGLGTEGIVFGGKRMGIYFLEPGAAFRNSNVVYDREDSAFATIGRGWSTGSGCRRCRLVPLVGHRGGPFAGGGGCLSRGAGGGRPHGAHHLVRPELPQEVVELWADGGRSDDAAGAVQ